jgi:SAM-dependent methyltransferase
LKNSHKTECGASRFLARLVVRAAPFALRAIRGALRRLNTYLSRRYESSVSLAHPMPANEVSSELDDAARRLQQLDLPDGAVREYFRKHLPRLTRTLTLIPPPRTSGRILELGCYMQITPFLQQWRGYMEVRGAYYGPLGHTDRRIASVRGEPFEVAVDLFDAELDRYPYGDSSFETVLACELIEHLQRDPMHLVLECRRILEDGGRLIVSTPNAASLTSVARVLHGYNNPQISSVYHRPRADAPEEAPHVREYTAFELQALLEAGGFEIEALLTEQIDEFAMHRPMWNFLEDNGYNSSLRGEQTYCVAVKRSDLPVTRYPNFLYSE